MKRDKNLIPLSRQHHQGLILSQLIKKDAPVFNHLPKDTEGKRKYVIQKWEEELEHHFELEETYLFPVLKSEDILTQEVNKLIDQHKEIKVLIDRLRDQEDSEEKMHQLGLLLEEHIRLEEREVFEQAQQLLPKDKLEKVGALLEEHAREG